MSTQDRTQAYSVGNKTYGGGRPMATVGAVNKLGYRERDRKRKAMQAAIARRLGMK